MKLIKILPKLNKTVGQPCRWFYGESVNTLELYRNYSWSRSVADKRLRLDSIWLIIKDTIKRENS